MKKQAVIIASAFMLLITSARAACVGFSVMNKTMQTLEFSYLNCENPAQRVSGQIKANSSVFIDSATMPQKAPISLADHSSSTELDIKRNRIIFNCIIKGFGGGLECGAW